MKLATLALALTLFTAPAFAADVDGKWTGSVDSPNGAIELTYTLKAEGDVLTGSMLGPDGSAVPIKDGKITGNQISFSLTLDFGAGPTVFNYTGEVSPAQLKLHSAFMDMAIEMILKKT